MLSSACTWHASCALKQVSVDQAHRAIGHQHLANGLGEGAIGRGVPCRRRPASRSAASGCPGPCPSGPAPRQSPAPSTNPKLSADCRMHARPLCQGAPASGCPGPLRQVRLRAEMAPAACTAQRTVPSRAGVLASAPRGRCAECRYAVGQKPGMQTSGSSDAPEQKQKERCMMRARAACGGCLVHKRTCKYSAGLRRFGPANTVCMGLQLQKQLSYMCPRQAATVKHLPEVQGNTLEHMLVSSADQPNPRRLLVACSAVQFCCR